ncbi:DUF2059 domain-containing protein [Cellulophaga baltica]|uniref:DUF2059 domain-containing protein n=1 Tax=Cellulophaga TaxID=104264 RepID=UPI001C07C698|nr:MULTISPECIES: DUF2059 domain-containing protein [Cellulophaga]MBU2995950.1 DUF2059 domain-containing protein [Cellulophaga baltica]MDO6767345.1 DUF2059 domain-containing protein [Cellulophaga sp. 1_MG-2023]
MKKLIFAIVLFTAITLQAQETTTIQVKAISLIKASGATSAFDDAIAQIGAAVPADKKDAYTAEANGTLDEIYVQLADLYAEEFTESEIDELNKFYQTDLGKKLSVKQNLITQKAMMIGQTWGMKVGGIAQKYMQ